MAELKRMSLENLIAVEVRIVARQESTIGRSAAAVFVITAEDIRRSGATTLPEVLRRVPGIDVARMENNKWAVGVRGFNDRFNTKLLVQVDGRTVYNPLFSGVYWDAVDYPLENIERIEIIRGPGASVWGANAVNGIINILTHPAEATPGGLISAGGGTEEHGFGTFRYGGAFSKDVHYRVYAKGVTRDEQFASSGDSYDGWSGANGGVRVDWPSSARDAITIQADLLRSDAERRDVRPMPVAPFVFTNLETETTRGGNVLGRWTHQLADDSSMVFQGYWDRFDREGDNGFLDVRFDTLDVDFQHEFPLDRRQKIVYGSGYRHIDAFLGPSADNGFVLSFPSTHPDVRLVSAFVQDQITGVGNAVSLTFGAKLEHNTFTGFEYQPSVRILWTPTQRQTGWAAVSRAVRTPSLRDDGLSFRQVPSFPAALGGAPLFGRLVGNSDFKSEQLIAYEIGYRAQATDRFSIDVASFYNVYDELTVVVPGQAVPGVVPGTFDLPLLFENRMNGATYGAELAATWQLNDAWRVYGAYAFLNTRLRPDAALPLSVAAAAELAEGQSPRHQLFLQSSWNLGRQMELDLIARVVGRLSGFDPPVERYGSWDARVGWDVNARMNIAVVGQNLLESHHAEFGTSPLLRSLLPEIERGVYGHVRWRF